MKENFRPIDIRDSQSDIKRVDFSVPQGNCLEPVLLNLYCSNDDSQSLGRYTEDHYLNDSFPSEEFDLTKMSWGDHDILTATSHEYFTATSF